MKKKLTLVLLACLLLTGCGGDAPADPPATQPTQPTVGAEQAQPTQPTRGPEQLQQAPAGPEVRELALLGVLQGEDYRSQWHEENRLCGAVWQTFSLSEDSAAAYPALAESLRELNRENERYGREFVQKNADYARELLAEGSAYFNGFTSTEECSVQRADEYILSIRCDGDEYTGGVHPYYWAYGINLDPETGEKLELTDILVRTDTLPEMLEKKILEKYPGEPFFSLSETLQDYEPDLFSWTLDYQGLTFYFAPYELASYAAGLLTATVWFDEAPELFREEYLRRPADGYVRALPANLPVEIDIRPGDELRDSFVLEAIREDSDYLVPCINLNGLELLDEDAWCYWLRPYLVCVGGKTYAYVESRSDNDYTVLNVYDLNGETPALVERVYGTGFHGAYFADEGEYGAIRNEVFADVGAFKLDTRIDLLGTMTGTGTYAVDPDTGLPRALEDWYTLDETRPPLTSLRPLTLPILPGGQAEEIPAGTQFYFLRTDGVSYVDMRLSDGRECRVEVETGPEGWGSLINGIDEWDCFEGLLYAG